MLKNWQKQSFVSKTYLWQFFGEKKDNFFEKNVKFLAIF